MRRPTDAAPCAVSGEHVDVEVGVPAERTCTLRRRGRATGVGCAICSSFPLSSLTQVCTDVLPFAEAVAGAPGDLSPGRHCTRALADAARTLVLTTAGPR
jgi:hypothetical protein